MNVDHPVTGETYEQVLADRPGALKYGLVEQRRRLGEPALRAAHPDRLACEGLVQVPRQSVDVVSLRHQAPCRPRALRIMACAAVCAWRICSSLGREMSRARAARCVVTSPETPSRPKSRGSGRRPFKTDPARNR